MKENILSTLSKEEIRQINIVSYDKGTIIFHEGDKCEFVCFVLSGEIEISSYTRKGNKIVYNQLSENSVFGNNLIFSDDNTYKGNVKCIKKCTLGMLNRTALLYVLRQNSDFLIEFLKIQSNFGKALNSKLKVFTIKDIEERFLYYLVLNKNHLYIKSVTDLAKNLFLTRETTSRLISKLVDKKIIARKGHIIYLLANANLE